MPSGDDMVALRGEPDAFLSHFDDCFKPRPQEATCAGVGGQASGPDRGSVKAAARLDFPARMAARMKRTRVDGTKMAAGIANTQNSAGTEAGLSTQFSGNLSRYAHVATAGAIATDLTS